MADDSWKLAAGIAATISQNAKTDHISLENGLDYVQKLNYNKIRQDELWDIWCKHDDKRFEEILGHPIDWSLFAEQPHKVYCKSIRQRTWEACIKEIAAKEGWRYYDVIALNQDPVYQREIGIKNPYPGKTLLDEKSLSEYRIEQQTKNETEVSEMVMIIGLGLFGVFIGWIIPWPLISFIFFAMVAIGCWRSTPYENGTPEKNGHDSGCIIVFLAMGAAAITRFMIFMQGHDIDNLPDALQIANVVAGILNFGWVIMTFKAGTRNMRPTK